MSSDVTSVPGLKKNLFYSPSASPVATRYHCETANCRPTVHIYNC